MPSLQLGAVWHAGSSSIFFSDWRFSAALSSILNSSFRFMSNYVGRPPVASTRAGVQRGRIHPFGPLWLLAFREECSWRLRALRRKLPSARLLRRSDSRALPRQDRRRTPTRRDFPGARLWCFSLYSTPRQYYSRILRSRAVRIWQVECRRSYLGAPRLRRSNRSTGSPTQSSLHRWNGYARPLRFRAALCRQWHACARFLRWSD